MAKNTYVSKHVIGKIEDGPKEGDKCVQRVSEQQNDGNPCNGSKGRSSHNPGVDRTLSPCVLSSQGKLGTSEPE